MPAVIRFAVLGFVLIAAAPAQIFAQSDPGAVTLKGQVVCSSCWHEADRTKVAYGTTADRACAVRCGKGGVAGALAVTADGATTLYLLEPGAYAIDKGDTSWTTVAGAAVEVTGVVRRDGDKTYLKVDALKVTSQPPES